MVHVHGRVVASRAARIEQVASCDRVFVPVDAGKHEAMALVADGTGRRLASPFTFGLDRPGLRRLVDDVEKLAGDGSVVEVGVESAGHYHRPVTASGVLPSSWTIVELNPGM